MLFLIHSLAILKPLHILGSSIKYWGCERNVLMNLHEVYIDLGTESLSDVKENGLYVLILISLNL